MKKPNPPQSQIQEVLFCLLTRINIDRRQMMLSNYVLDLPKQIERLRNKYGLKIDLEEIVKINKYDREVRYGKYILKNKILARETYKQMQLKNGTT